jgi:hypothetical protein
MKKRNKQLEMRHSNLQSKKDLTMRLESFLSKPIEMRISDGPLTQEMKPKNGLTQLKNNSLSSTSSLISRNNFSKMLLTMHSRLNTLMKLLRSALASEHPS